MTDPWGRGLAGFGVLCALAFGALLPAACDEETSAVASSSGAGGGDAGCYSGPPAPLFVITISAHAGPLPADTTLAVKWSAGEEPSFSLDDPSSWLSLEDGSNVVCGVDKDAGLPLALDQLRCELWTSGATDLVITAGALPPYQQTLVPLQVPGCDEPVPQEIDVVVGVEPDAGRR